MGVALLVVPVAGLCCMLLMGVAAGIGTNVREQAWAFLGRLPSSALAVITLDMHAVRSFDDSCFRLWWGCM